MTGGKLSPDAARWRSLLRRIARVTGRAERAEDYLHSAYIRLEAYRQRTVVTNPDGLLVKIAANLCVDESRQERTRAKAPQSVYDLIDLADMRPLQDEVLEARKRLERVRAGLLELSPRTREVFLMHRIEGMKYREIAARLGITVSAVEKHIAKAALFLDRWAKGW